MITISSRKNEIKKKTKVDQVQQHSLTIKYVASQPSYIQTLTMSALLALLLEHFNQSGE